MAAQSVRLTVFEIINQGFHIGMQVEHSAFVVVIHAGCAAGAFAVFVLYGGVGAGGLGGGVGIQRFGQYACGGVSVVCGFGEDDVVLEKRLSAGGFITGGVAADRVARLAFAVAFQNGLPEKYV